MQVGAFVEIRLDKVVIQALQLDINAHTVRDAIVASKLKVKAPHITCAPVPPLSAPGFLGGTGLQTGTLWNLCLALPVAVLLSGGIDLLSWMSSWVPEFIGTEVSIPEGMLP